MVPLASVYVCIAGSTQLFCLSYPRCHPHIVALPPVHLVQRAYVMCDALVPEPARSRPGNRDILLDLVPLLINLFIPGTYGRASGSREDAQLPHGRVLL